MATSLVSGRSLTTLTRRGKYKVIIHKSRREKFYGTGIEIWAGLGSVGSTDLFLKYCTHTLELLE